MDKKESEKETTITIKIDRLLANAAKELFEDLGMDLKTGIVVYLKQVVRQRKIPFEIVAVSNWDSEDFYDSDED